ncbi:MAG: ATP-binding protein [Dysgonamonadaceae bacterium]|jgi:predicted AAA+ superfamily ATPase|nr:ATP-binding protein [Dysgonamonadaceae bacterium]
MQRKSVSNLTFWKGSDYRMPLLVTGARQIGKTHTILEFGKNEYRNVLNINFEFNKSFKGIFEQNLEPQRILREISVRMGETILPNETLLFFDEIQACPAALNSLKYFFEQAPEYHIIAAGSLLGVALHREGFSFPVGKVMQMKMYPLDFEEFLWALGQQEATNLIRDCFTNNEKCLSHDKLMEYYLLYLQTGGMPQVVQHYIEHKDFTFVRALQQNIIVNYISDMGKYSTPAMTSKTIAVFQSIPSQLTKENHKFQFKIIKSGARAKDYQESIDWLFNSDIVRKCTLINDGFFPLNSNANPTFYKAYLSDVGLLAAQYQIPEAAFLSDFPAFDNIKGSLAENYVMNSLISNGYEPHYWVSEGSAELDFVIQDKDGKIIPLETKSSDNVKAKSLKVYCEKYKPETVYRVSAKNFGFGNGIKSVPLYAAFCI